MRCLFVCEGSSDIGIAGHIERIAAERGIIVDVTVPDYSLLQERVGGRVEDKVRAGLKLGGEFDFIAAHRDCDTSTVAARRKEITDAVTACDGSIPLISVIPVRMTEAWLVLDERALRRVAANPNGTFDLSLPTCKEAERLADPKAFLRETLAKASGASGRRLRKFHGRFDQHRTQLLQGLNPGGDICKLSSWNNFVHDVNNLLDDLTIRGI